MAGQLLRSQQMPCRTNVTRRSKQSGSIADFALTTDIRPARHLLRPQKLASHASRTLANGLVEVRVAWGSMPSDSVMRYHSRPDAHEQIVGYAAHVAASSRRLAGRSGWVRAPLST